MRAVLFWDFDGTLAEAPHIWSNTLYRLLLQAVPNCGVTISDIRKFTAKIFPWDTPEEEHLETTYDMWWEEMNRRFLEMYRQLGIAYSLAREIVQGIRPILIDPARYRLYPDAIETLRQCKTLGYENVILSNNYPELPDVAKALGLSAFIRDYAVSAHVGYDKPHPNFFAYAKKLAGRADKYYMIGDNPKADIEGGRLAGMRTILVHKDVPNCADYVCKSLLEIVKILRVDL